MGFRGRFTLRSSLVELALLCLLAFNTKAGTNSISLESMGARYGFGSNDSSDDFREYEVFTDLSLPWSWKVGRSFRLKSRVDIGVGMLRERGTDAAMGEAGPLLILSYKQFPITLAVGSNATGFSRSYFETKDLGLGFEFTTHIGLNLDFATHFRLGYRYQHTSNAGLGSPNPGLNMHMIGVSYVF